MHLVDQSTNPFPVSLGADTSSAVLALGGDLAELERANVRRHNRAVHAYILNRPLVESLTKQERMVLDFCQCIHTWCGHPEASTGYESEHITWPLICAFNNVLNLDLGRLDGGVLSEWVCAQARRAGLDPDTGELL